MKTLVPKPMLAYNGEIDLTKLHYPLYVSRKYDGIRLYKWEGKWHTRSQKESINPKIITELDRMFFPDRIDCELMYGKDFHEGQSLIRGSGSIDNLPEPIVLVVHDYMFPQIFSTRKKYLESGFVGYQHSDIILPVVAKHIFCVCPEDINNASKELSNNDITSIEGLILRSPHAHYKFNGRSTLNEQALLKYYTTITEEATIVGFNQLFRNAIRHTTRAKHKIPAGMLGSFRVKSEKWGEFNLAGRLTSRARVHIWENQSLFMTTKIKFSYKPYGTKDKPRHPIYIPDPKTVVESLTTEPYYSSHD